MVTPEDFNIKGSMYLATRIRHRISKVGHCVLGVSGDVPADIYTRLGREEDINWKKVHLFLIDERLVPVDDEASNITLLKETLLVDAAIPDANVYFPDLNLASDPTAMVASYSARLDELWRIGTPDVLALGYGDDGHIGALFPPLTQPELSAPEKCVYTHTNRYTLKDHLSVTLKVMKSARVQVMFFRGKDKTKSWARMIDSDSLDPRFHPAYALLRRGGATVYSCII